MADARPGHETVVVGGLGGKQQSGRADVVRGACGKTLFYYHQFFMLNMCVCSCCNFRLFINNLFINN